MTSLGKALSTEHLSAAVCGGSGCGERWEEAGQCWRQSSSTPCVFQHFCVPGATLSRHLRQLRRPSQLSSEVATSTVPTLWVRKTQPGEVTPWTLNANPGGVPRAVPLAHQTASQLCPICLARVDAQPTA